MTGPVVVVVSVVASVVVSVVVVVVSVVSVLVSVLVLVVVSVVVVVVSSVVVSVTTPSVVGSVVVVDGLVVVGKEVVGTPVVGSGPVVGPPVVVPVSDVLGMLVSVVTVVSSEQPLNHTDVARLKMTLKPFMCANPPARGRYHGRVTASNASPRSQARDDLPPAKDRPRIIARSAA